jgi:hypothetical protein
MTRTRIASPKVAAVAALLLVAAGQGLAPEARAGTSPNAINPNGISANGLTVNGVFGHGIRCCDDAARRGFADRGSAADPNRLRLRAIVLPGETAAAAAE